MKSKKILVLVESLRINKTSSGIGRSKFINSLVEYGHEIVCLYEDNVESEITWLNNLELVPVQYSVYKKSVLEYVPKIRGLATHFRGYHRIIKYRIKDWKNEILKQLDKSDFDLIISLGSGDSFLPHYAMLYIDDKTPYLANFHDPYPMSLYPEPYKKRKNIFYYNQEKWTKKMISRATYVSFPSLYLKDWMLQFFPEIASKNIILPHLGVELPNLPSNINDKNIKLEKGKFNLLHAGTLLGPRKVDALFAAFHKFIESDPEIKENARLTILGKVAKEHKNIKNSIKESGDTINIILDRVSYKKSLELIAIADVSIIVEADAEISPFMPGKLADLIFLEKPILALGPKRSETLRVLGEDYPFSARVNDEENILKVLFLLWGKWKKNELILLNKEKLKRYVSSDGLNKMINKLLESPEEL